MDFLSILLLSVALAMDATAVAASRGLAAERVTVAHAFRVALFFGGSQAAMPLLGYLVGALLGRYVSAWHSFIAFALLVAIGAKMLWEARGEKKDDAAPAAQGDATPAAQTDGAKMTASDPFGLKVMTLLALATSIDAFAAGITLPLMAAPLPVSLVTIGVTTAVLSVAGLYVGKRLGEIFGRRLDAFGGIVLIGLGVKTLVAHFL